MFDHQSFSIAMKKALTDYLYDGSLQQDFDVGALQALSKFNPTNLKTDQAKLAFWINVYNGLTNHQIISHTLKESVWELPGFFSERRYQIGEFFWSLDDIEHGVLRRNGARRNGKPRQFRAGDPRWEFMLERFDPRIHFALNCGSISCPSIAFYSEENIDEELAQAEQNFVSQEYLVDHEKQVITCSEIFVWYQSDFPNDYLNGADRHYELNLIAYQ